MKQLLQLMGGGLLLIVLVGLSYPAMGQDDPEPPPPGEALREVTFDEINDVASNLYCPVCENEPLHTCGAPACVEWREEIGEQLAAGRTPEQVQAYFIDEYGNRVVGIPEDNDLRLLSIIGPLVVLIAGAVVGWFTFARWRNVQQPMTQFAATQSASQTPADDPYRSRLEDDLRL